MILSLSRNGIPNHPSNRSEEGISFGSGGGCVVSMIVRSEPRYKASEAVAKQWMKGEVDGVLLGETDGNELVGRVVNLLN